MGLKKYSIRSYASRFSIGFDFSEITKSEPEKSLTVSLRRKSARNNTGMITVRHKGGGHKRRYRIVDFKRSKLEIPAKVLAVEYDPNRSARIALICYIDGSKSYILAPVGLKVGDQVISSDKADIKPGNCLSLGMMPVGTAIHNIELRPGKGGQIAKGAGSMATLVSKEGKFCQVRLPSGEVKFILSACRASVGQVSNVDNENIVLGKAGRARWRGIRPSVRGMAMNPVDHPLGGGEGRGKGHHPVTPWGQPCKGYKTRHKKRTDWTIVKARK
jgi:large subunit ribosomal protein L2